LWGAFEVKKTVSTENSSGGSSYGQILKASSIVGGGEAVSQLIGLIRTKAVAMLLGPSGMGLVNLYVSAVGLVGLVAQLGINQSGIRAVAEANSQNDQTKVAQVVTTLRRACWLTGITGWILAATFAWPLSVWIFGSTEHAWAFAILGCTLVMFAVSNGQTALLNGIRRIGDLARIQVFAAILSTLIAIFVYGALGDAGILPVIILTAAVQLTVSWYYSRTIQLTAVNQSWNETFKTMRSLISLGIALMYTGLVVSIVSLITRALIIKELDLSANGFYQAAWMVSGMLATFILAAMGRDFYPRLTAIHSDAKSVNKLVNEQVEIGILLGLPGLVGSVVFAPTVIQILYSSSFLPAAQLLPYFAAGVLMRLLSWPIGFILMAKSESFTYATVATVFQSAQLGFTLLLLPKYGLAGAATAFAVAEAIQFLLYFAAGHRSTHFILSAAVWRLTAFSVASIGAACLMLVFSSGVVGLALSTSLAVIVSICSLRALIGRLPSTSKLVYWVQRTPMLKNLM